MKNTTLVFLALFLFNITQVKADGICIVNADQGIFLKLATTDIHVSVNNQIATIKSTQKFVNNTGADVLIKYGFPMSETGSALELRWLNNGYWFTADFAPNPQDTIIPGDPGGVSSPAQQMVNDYVGVNPLYFNLEQTVPKDSSITFEVTYVDLLFYEFNQVEFLHKNDYSTFQTEPLERQYVYFELFSDRTINWLDLQSHPGALIDNNTNHGTLEWEAINGHADTDIYIKYELNADELGIFSFSTFIADSLLHCDDSGEGYLAMIIEPDPSENTQVINKVFTLIIDESGSMSGDKIIQARNAAEFIVTNLNAGDEFNIVSFDSDAVSFESDHVPYNPINETAALNFISNITAGGGTGFNGAFSAAIPQFSNSDPDKANIIIFFTDGNANESNQDVLSHLAGLLNTNQVDDLSIFTFGIGESVNHQLLTQIAIQNNGLYESLGDDELLEVLSHFYLTIQNPVLLNTSITFDPPVINELYPIPLPNLFKGSQLIVVGRFAEASPVTVYLDGTAFGNPVQYSYDISLSDTISQELQFLPRLWAKRKMEYLYQQFFIAGIGTPEADILEDSIVNTSLCFGVISPFTSFEDNSGGGSSVETEELEYMDALISAYPNPFSENTTFNIEIEVDDVRGTYYFEIYDAVGKLIRRIPVEINQDGTIVINWDGMTTAGKEVAKGLYYCTLQIENKIYRAKVIKM